VQTVFALSFGTFTNPTFNPAKAKLSLLDKNNEWANDINSENVYSDFYYIQILILNSARTEHTAIYKSRKTSLHTHTHRVHCAIMLSQYYVLIVHSQTKISDALNEDASPQSFIVFTYKQHLYGGCTLHSQHPSKHPGTSAFVHELNCAKHCTEESVQSINARRGENKSVYRSSKITVSCGHNFSSCRVNLESSEVSWNIRDAQCKSL